jgi:2,3-bisphosphoglycerate-dependent phosphoglycerate mutase
MKIFVALLTGFLFFAAACENLRAQHRDVTVILLRHAEKDKAEEESSLDPNLSEGRARAEKLVGVIGGYEPEAIFSSAFKRTRNTVAPLAARGEFRMMAQYYDHRNLKQIADSIMQGKYRRVVVVGHNSTTPALVNLLIGQEKYKALGEDEYDKIWIVKIKRNKNKPHEVKEQLITY